MDAPTFVQAVKDKAAAIETAIANFFNAHPEIEADAAKGATDALNDLKATAEAGVDAAEPQAAPDINSVIDQAVAKIDADLATTISEAQAAAQAKKDALLAAKQ